MEDNYFFLAYIKMDRIRYKLFVSVSLDIFFLGPANNNSSDVIRCCIYEHLTNNGMAHGVIESVAYVGMNPDPEKFDTIPTLSEPTLDVNEMIEKYLEGMR